MKTVTLILFLFQISFLILTIFQYQKEKKSLHIIDYLIFYFTSIFSVYNLFKNKIINNLVLLFIGSYMLYRKIQIKKEDLSQLSEEKSQQLFFSFFFFINSILKDYKLAFRALYNIIREFEIVIYSILSVICIFMVNIFSLLVFITGDSHSTTKIKLKK